MGREWGGNRKGWGENRRVGRFRIPSSTKSALLSFYFTRNFAPIVEKGVDRSHKSCQNMNLHTSEIENYFRFVSQTIGVEATILLIRMQNLVKIGKELWA